MTVPNDFQANPQPGTVQILPQLPVIQGRWQPVIGPETLALAQSMPQASRDTIIAEAVRILSRCVPPLDANGSETGLAVGYVQSGKTMSFTTVATLARDNGYRMVIVIAGTSIQLLDQSRDRLTSDLRLESPTERRPWRHVPTPTVAINSHVAIQDLLAEWNDQAVPRAELKTVLITVMKQYQQLQDLVEVLQRIDLNRVPTLIIDDEGDQAGLNTLVRRGRQSTTYQRLLALKDLLPHHSLIQYTATPQAPLLINLIDVLSPSFVEVLTPGTDYTGGREFFSRQANLVRTIPPNQIPTPGNRLAGPPPTLLQAFRFFFLGVAVHIATGDREPKRSMMVHPTRLTIGHHQYSIWAADVRNEWMRILALPNAEQDRTQLLELFRQDYDDLRTTHPPIPPFETLLECLPRALRRTLLKEVNRVGGRAVQINWSESDYWILVGGQAMDRGFTVKGLTVTYMPRDTGVGNADTVQQRARFFGYRGSYLGLCRVFLEGSAIDAFNTYLDHELDIRNQLLEHRNTGRPMSEWRRQFFLNRNLRPTRDNVIDIAYRRSLLGNDWVYPEGLHDSAEALQANRMLFERYRATLNFIQHDGLDARRDSPRNFIARNVRLQLAYEEFLTRVRLPRLEDSQMFAPLFRLIQVHLAMNPDSICTVILIANGMPRRRNYSDNQITELFQGRQYAQRNGQRVLTYHGDRALGADANLCIQLRYLNLGPPRGALIAENVPHFAVWVPAAIAQDVVHQPQGGIQP